MRLMIFGYGYTACYVAEAARRELTNVKLLPFQPESEVPEIYGACDVALIPLRHGITENSVPCKTYSIMAAGKPYIAGVDEGSTVSKLSVGVQVQNVTGTVAGAT